ncbi:MAG TPA: hypothetical protein P5514_02450 [Bacteroidales bacterium]|nr:hypothetical protein [Bacteroidales bacterium]HRX95781.1 hypothetical protein [Bacteroidales bacterium]
MKTTRPIRNFTFNKMQTETPVYLPENGNSIEWLDDSWGGMDGGRF